MSDFPQSRVLPLLISSWSLRYSAMGDLRQLFGNTGAGNNALTWTANLAIYVPISLPFDYPLNRFFWANGSSIAGTNVNVGLFTQSGKKLATTGSTAQSGTSTLQFAAPTTTMWIPSGNYYLGLACDGTTSRISGTNPSVLLQQQAGVLAQASNFALADPATFATPSTTLYPVVGITRTGSGMPI